MNKDLILLQKKCNATAVVVLDEEYKKLGKIVSMKAEVGDSFLFTTPPPFADAFKKLAQDDVIYFVIRGIDKVTENQQNRFIGLVKDREFNGFNFPENCIIVFTIGSEAGIKNIIPGLYHFCVVAL